VPVTAVAAERRIVGVGRDCTAERTHCCGVIPSICLPAPDPDAAGGVCALQGGGLLGDCQEQLVALGLKFRKWNFVQRLAEQRRGLGLLATCRTVADDDETKKQHNHVQMSVLYVVWPPGGVADVRS
jgi:hypothetical protein